MANATTVAPSKEKVEVIEIGAHKVKKGSNEHLALTKEYDTERKYMFELVQTNLEREQGIYQIHNNRATPMPHQKHTPQRNIVFSSQIVWNGARTNIRYYDGCDSIFVSEQPKEKEVIDQLKAQTQPRFFLDGKFGIHGDERMMLMFLEMCSWNVESPFRTRTATAIFVPINNEKKIIAESDKLDMIEKAMQLAKEAKSQKMLIHASYLGISMKDFDSDNDRTEQEIRIEYRKKASQDPVGFVNSYGDKTIETRYYIQQALLKGLISNKFNRNKATWGSNNTEICDISGLSSHEAIAEKLLEFSQLEEGVEFEIQLKALFS